MSCNQNIASFYGVETLQDNSLISTLEENLKSFLDYGFLQIGGFVNVNIPTSGLYSKTFHNLKPTNDPSRPVNTIWQTPRKDWVWESGITYRNTSPINISGIYINSTFVPGPTGNSTASYTLDYNNGQVIFNQPLAQSTNISLNYSYRWCQVSKFNSNTEAWKQLQQLTFRPDSQIDQKDKGSYAILANHRIQLPAIAIETVPRNDSVPYELGSLLALRSQDVVLHIYAENINDCTKIMDIIRLQEDKSVLLYDLNKVVSSGLYGLNYNGSKNTSGKNYGQLINDSYYKWTSMLIRDVSFVEMQKNPTSSLVWCMVRLTSEIII
jgi:hypothetical protein